MNPRSPVHTLKRTAGKHKAAATPAPAPAPAPAPDATRLGLNQATAGSKGRVKRNAKVPAQAHPAHCGRGAPGTRAAGLRVRGRAQLVGKAVYGKTKTDQRSRLSHAVADKLVYAHDALHLREKLQSASYVQKVEKWDTDSDSDESDDEADLAM